MSAAPAPRSEATLAIALAEGRSSEDEIPRITASGRGAVAEQIIAIALDHGVKLREDADLAGVLAALDIDSPIPLGALSTVTGILSYVHRAKGAPDDSAEGAPDTGARGAPGDSAIDNSEGVP
jgi:flagellar biosynthesis protein